MIMTGRRPRNTHRVQSFSPIAKGPQPFPQQVRPVTLTAGQPPHLFQSLQNRQSAYAERAPHSRPCALQCRGVDKVGLLVVPALGEREPEQRQPARLILQIDDQTGAEAHTPGRRRSHDGGRGSSASGGPT